MALLFWQQRVQDEPQAPKLSHVVAWSHSGMEQVLIPEPWPSLNPLMSLSSSAGAVSFAFHLLQAKPSERGCISGAQCWRRGEW